MSLVAGVYQLAQPHVLTGSLGYNLGYDDGVYLGIATRVVHGTLPYRDFVFVHPPGIAVLLAPVALLGRVLGTHDALVVARVLTVLVTVVNAGLAGVVVRRLGKVAALTAGLALALWPLNVAVSRTLELEPYLVLFSLLGLAVATDGRRLASGRRLQVAGALLGVALAVKVWAILPVVALLVCLPRRRQLLDALLGVVVGAGALCLPFFVFAPRDFVQDVLVAQLQRVPSPAPTSLGERARLLAGGQGADQSPTFAVLLLGVLVLLLIWTFVAQMRWRTRSEVLLLAAWVVAVLGLFASSDLADHYVYFPAAFLAPLLGVCAQAVWRPVRERTHIGNVRARWLVQAAAGTALVVSATTLLWHQLSYAREYLGEAGPAAQLAAAVPAGACVLSDYPVDLLAGERYTSARDDCPSVVDPYGLYLAHDEGRQPHPAPPFNPAFQDEWFDWLESADYVALRIPFSSFIPWSAGMISWFDSNYRLVDHIHTDYERPFIDRERDVYVYANENRVGG